LHRAPPAATIASVRRRLRDELDFGLAVEALAMV
jgi:hypothetical protein